MTGAQVVDLIKANVAPLASLTITTSTGGLLNAANVVSPRPSQWRTSTVTATPNCRCTPSASRWYVWDQSGLTWVVVGDISVTAGCDEDGDTDVRVFRPSTGR